jgi:hypothetical protein
VLKCPEKYRSAPGPVCGSAALPAAAGPLLASPEVQTVPLAAKSDCARPSRGLVRHNRSQMIGRVD